MYYNQRQGAIYTEFSEGVEDLLEESDRRMKQRVENDKKDLLTLLKKLDDDYAVVLPTGESSVMEELDLAKKSEFEKKIKEFIENADFMCCYKNDPDCYDVEVGEEMTNATHKRWGTVTHVVSPSSESLFILHNFK